MNLLKKDDLSDKCLFDLMERLADMSHMAGAPKKAIEHPMIAYYAQELGKRLNITPIQAFLLALFVNFYPDSSIETKDMARHLDCTNIAVMACHTDITVLKDEKYICEHNAKDGINYNIPLNAIKALRENHGIERRDYSKMEAEELFMEINSLFSEYMEMNISYSEFCSTVQSIMKSNQQYQFCRNINNFDLDKDAWMFAVRACTNYYFNQFDRIDADELRHVFGMRIGMRHVRQLRSNKHQLMKQNIIEPAGDELANADEWRLTRYAANELMGDLCPIQENGATLGVLSADSISPKPLFYPTQTSQQISELERLLMPEKFAQVQASLVAHNMRKGFACLFYGTPGTDKTETVLQVARKTGRAIMQVDMSQVRDKYVGESEKNVKRIFTSYNRLCKESKVTPILLLNEADALFSVRLTEMKHSVDQMANTMQNIILQEMENLDGILIATTNLTQNLDAAFDRRFLYKVEFQKPTAEESRHIWQAMLPSLSDDNARSLASKYDFSGGQIENIARKQVVNNILHDTEELDMSLIRSACDQERLNRQNGERIRITGFC